MLGFFFRKKLIIVHVTTFVNRLSAFGVYFLVHVHVIWKYATIKFQKSDNKKHLLNRLMIIRCLSDLEKQFCCKVFGIINLTAPNNIFLVVLFIIHILDKQRICITFKANLPTYITQINIKININFSTERLICDIVVLFFITNT